MFDYYIFAPKLTKQIYEQVVKLKKAPCKDIKYGEFPDLLFGKSDDGLVYFDATHYIRQKGDVKKHNIKTFEIGFMHWENAVRNAYSIPAGSDRRSWSEPFSCQAGISIEVNAVQYEKAP